MLLYLRGVSSVRLENFRRADARALDEPPTEADWDELDVELVRDLVRMWELVVTPWLHDRFRFAPAPGKLARLRGQVRFTPEDADLAGLRAATETWCLRVLLLTERPRRLRRYKLPRLTCVYRYSSALLGMPHPVPLVADSDFVFALATSCGLTRAQTKQLDEWATHHRFSSPSHIARGLDEIRLRVATTPAPELLDVVGVPDPSR